MAGGGCDRVVVVHGPVDEALAACLGDAGLSVVYADAMVSVWAPGAADALELGAVLGGGDSEGRRAPSGSAVKSSYRQKSPI